MRIKYERLFRLGDFENERLGIELDIPDKADPQENLKLIRDEIHEFFYKIHGDKLPQTEQTTPQEERIYDPIKSYVDAVNNCSDLIQLTTQFKYLKNSSKKEIREAYENRLNELSK